MERPLISGYLIDSNVLIDYVGRKFYGHGEERLDQIFDSLFYYSIISRIEVLGFNATSMVLDSLEGFLGTGVRNMNLLVIFATRL